MSDALLVVLVVAVGLPIVLGLAFVAPLIQQRRVDRLNADARRPGNILRMEHDSGMHEPPNPECWLCTGDFPPCVPEWVLR